MPSDTEGRPDYALDGALHAAGSLPDPTWVSRFLISIICLIFAEKETESLKVRGDSRRKRQSRVSTPGLSDSNLCSGPVPAIA